MEVWFQLRSPGKFHAKQYQTLETDFMDFPSVEITLFRLQCSALNFGNPSLWTSRDKKSGIIKMLFVYF